MGNYYAGMINNTGGYGELKHHGILGQKWGVRRFQNADGSLTAAGRERYGSGGYEGYEAEARKITEKYNKRVGKKNVSIDEISRAEADFDAQDAVVLNKYLKNVDEGVGYLQQHHDAMKALRDAENTRDKVYRFDEHGRDVALQYANEVTGRYANRSAKLTDGSEGTVAEALADAIVRENVKREWDSRNGKGSYQKMLADTDYMYSPYYKYNNKDSKWDFESEILSLDSLDFDKWNQLPKSETDKYLHLFTRMQKESGDYYNSTPVTTAFDKANRKIDEERNKLESMVTRATNIAKRPYEAREKQLKAQYERSKSRIDESKWLDVYEEMYEAMQRARNNIRDSKEYKDTQANVAKYKDELVGVVLRDIGYTDSPEARKMAYYMVYYD